MNAAQNPAAADHCRVCTGRRCDAFMRMAERFIEQNRTDSIQARAGIKLFTVWLDENLPDQPGDERG
jgi:hypothetical protein